MNRTGKIRRRPDTIAQDRDVVAALEKVDGYSPGLSELSLDAVKVKFQEMTTKQNAAVQAEAAMLTTKAEALQMEEDFHDLILRVKKAVLAQFGEDSNEAQELGLKKKSEYKRPKRMVLVTTKVA